MLKKRYLTKYIQEDLQEKMVFIGGPRQVGKTTLSTELLSKYYKKTAYFNWDYREDRNKIREALWPADAELIILDETDSGLDIDALQMVGHSVNSLRDQKRSILIVTHYQRLLDYIHPDVVHVMAKGRILKTSDASLAKELEAKGYGWLEHELPQ